MVPDHIVKMAIEEAKKSTYHYKVGCVIFNKKKILSKGHNYERSVKRLLPKFLKYPGSIHAEVDAIIKAKRNLKGCDLLVIRINNKKELRIAKPCQYCMSYIEYVGIRKIYYSISGYPYFEVIGNGNND